jgi:hypothetical protein
LEHVKAYKLEHPEVSLKSVLTEARKTYKTVKTVKQDTRKNAPKVKNRRRQVVKKNLDNPDEQQLLKVLQTRLELDQQQTPAVTKKTTPKRGKTTASKKTTPKRGKTTNSNKKKRVQRSKKNINDYTDTRSVTVGDEQDSNELIDL